MMKKLTCIFLVIAILLTGCQTTPVEGPAAETPTASTVTETPAKTEDVGETPTDSAETTGAPTNEETPTEGTTAESTPTQGAITGETPTGTTAGTATSTTTSTTTSTANTKPTATPVPTPTPEVKTFSIPVSVAGGVKTNTQKVNFKGYYKDGDEKSGTVIVAQDATTSFTLTRNSSRWAFSAEYSTFPTAFMKVTTSGSTATVNVTFKKGTSVSVDAISQAHFVYVNSDTVNNGIPTMMINVETNTDYYNLTESNDKAVKEIWSQATYAIVEGSTKTYNTKEAQGTLKIKRRGFTSFSSFPKKSYTVKLTDGVPLLGMESNKDWVLVANYSDKSLLRNYFAYNISNQMNTSWAPECNFIDVYITYGSTSDYLGTYLLVEKIEATKEKINIEEMTEEDTSIGAISSSSSMTKALAGSFVVELETFDRASSGDMLIQTSQYQLSVKSPDKDYFAPTANTTNVSTHNATKNKNQAEYIRTFFNVVDEMIRTDNYDKYEPYIDIDSFVDYYILNELAKNVDGNFRLSTYFYKDKGGKLKITVWDFDIAFGNCYYLEDSNGNDGSATSGYYIRTGTSWYQHMFKSYKFRDKVKARWEELRKGCLSDSNIASMLNQQASVLEKAANANFKRWDILGTYVWPNPSAIVACDTYQENVQYLIKWIQQRAAWLDSNIAKAVI